MGEPDVFTFYTTPFLGVGISMRRMSGEYGKAVDINISLPFFSIAIFTAKIKNNKWFNFNF
jgi:hypothetical protein